MQNRAITADDFITEVQFLQSRATHYWRKAVERLEKLERFALQFIFVSSVLCFSFLKVLLCSPFCESLFCSLSATF